MTEYRNVASRAALTPGRLTKVEVDGREIALANVDGQFFAIANKCTCVAHFAGHRKSEQAAVGRLAAGRLAGATVACPLHGTVFDLRSGSPVSGFGDAPISTYEVREVGDRIEIATMTDSERLFWHDRAAAR